MSKNGGCSPYAGKISNSGTQVVKAPWSLQSKLMSKSAKPISPVSPVTHSGKSVVKKGEDLRTGKK